MHAYVNNFVGLDNIIDIEHIIGVSLSEPHINVKFMQSVCLSVVLSVCRSVCLSFCLYVHDTKIYE